MKEVNLFESYLKTPDKKALIGQSLKIGAVVMLAAYCIVASGIFSYWLILKQKDNSLTRKIEDQRQQIASLKAVESLHLLIKERLKILGSVELADRVDFSLLLAEIEKVRVPGMTIADFEAGADGKLVLNGEAQDAVVLAEFLEKLERMGQSRKEGFIEVSEASRSKEGLYNFSITSNVGD